VYSPSRLVARRGGSYEGINAVIQGIKKTARGFRNAERFKTAIYFHGGGLDLDPHETR
jgi:hypothetical protein